MRMPRITKRRRWPLERAAAFAAVAIVAMTAAAILAPVWFVGARETETLADRLNASVAGDTRREIEGLFTRIEALQETARSVLAAGAVDIDDRRGRNALFMGLLKADPSISWVSFGFENGDFYGANRRELGRYRLVESRWDPERATATRAIDYLVDYEGELYPTHSKVVENDYNAIDRSWFQEAHGAHGPIWTDVYRFASSDLPGLNTAVRVERDGNLVGIVSIAIELNRLDEYLANRMADWRGVAFLLGPRGEVVAASEPAPPRDVTGDLLPTAAQSGRPMLAATAAKLRDMPPDRPASRKLHSERLGGAAFLNVRPLGSQGWRVGTLLPESAFAGDILERRKRMILAALAALTLAALVAIRATRALFVAPLQAASQELARLQRFDLSARRRVHSGIEEVHALEDGLEGARQSLAAFARYAPAELARRLMLERGGQGALVERRTLTVLFLDLEGFTSATETYGHRLAPQLNDFLTAMSEEVRAAGGVVDKFIGDAVMALFGAPDLDEDHALNACRAALGCVAALERLNRAWIEEGRPTFRMRVGVNTGRVLVGSIGSPDRLNYTAIGDPVNLAARLESLNRDYGTRIMIGAQTHDIVKYDVAARRLDAVRVKGKSERVPVYELLALTDRGDRPAAADWTLRYEAALDAMADGEATKARRLFEEAIRLRGGDAAAEAMLAKLAAAESADDAGRDPAFDLLEAAADQLNQETRAVG